MHPAGPTSPLKLQPLPAFLFLPQCRNKSKKQASHKCVSIASMQPGPSIHPSWPLWFPLANQAIVSASPAFLSSSLPFAPPFLPSFSSFLVSSHPCSSSSQSQIRSKPDCVVARSQAASGNKRKEAENAKSVYGRTENVFDATVVLVCKVHGF